MEWIEVDNPPGKKFPKWARSAGFDNGIVYVPGAIADNEMNVILCAGYDGTTIVHYLKHAYFPAKWLAAEFPKAKDICEKIEATVIETIARSS